MHLTRRYWTFLAIMAVLLLAACGAPLASPGPASPGPASPGPVGPAGSAGPVDPGLASHLLKDAPNWDAYKKKCERLNQTFEPANVVYNPTEQMLRGNSHAIEAAVTLLVERPPQEILETREPVARQLLVSCVIEAELRAAEAEFNIQPQGWQSESLLTSPTAHWTWFVTPEKSGKHELILAFRPVITVEDQAKNSLLVSHITASTQPYRIVAEVSVPPDQWVADKFDRATALLKSAEGMAAAFTALVAAVIALLTIKRRRARARSSPNNAIPDQ